MIWNPGDDTDLNEGGDGTDTVEVNGGNGAEQFTATANGTRVRFDRVVPAPFSIDIGTSEKLTLNANGGDDSFSATGNLAALIAITVDGGTGNDTILGSNGVDFLLGGDGNDFVDGQQGNDTALLGAGDDTFQWDPGDGNDIVEGQDGNDKMVFNGNAGNESFEASANGQRLRFTRNVGNIVMDVNGVESVDVNALGGPDTITVNDLSGTNVVELNARLAAVIGGTAGDGQPDNVIVNGTGGDDVVSVSGNASGVSVIGLAAQVNVTGAEATNDRLTVKALGGDDVVDASGVAAGSIQLTLDGGPGDDILIGGEGNDNLLGGPGDDVLIGGPGNDTLDGGGDGDVVIQLVGSDAVTSATAADREWLAKHARVDDGKTVLDDRRQEAHASRSRPEPAHPGRLGRLSTPRHAPAPEPLHQVLAPAVRRHGKEGPVRLISSEGKGGAVGATPSVARHVGWSLRTTARRPAPSALEPRSGRPRSAAPSRHELAALNPPHHRLRQRG